MGSLDTSTHNPVPEVSSGADKINGYHAESKGYSYPRHVLHKPRPMRIIIIGAGITGIGAVKMFKERFEATGLPVTLTIYEKNADVGGTWLENRYPGCACDVPAHAYGYSWEGNPNWTQAYVTAPEIFEFFKGRAMAYGVYNYVHLNQRVVKAAWLEEESHWQVEVEDLVNSRLFTDHADVIINAMGTLNNWKWPDIAGLHTYKGHLVHSSRWDDSFDFSGKKVAVIGSGSSAIQIVPILRSVASHLVSFNRSATWITPEFGAEWAPEGRETTFSEEQRRAWSNDPSAYLKYRKTVEGSLNKIFDVLFKDSPLQREAAEKFRTTMRERLGKKAYLGDKLIPDFAVGCRRVTPGQNYLESLAADNVTVENGTILKITESGIEMEDGTFHAVDAIVCATGFDTSWRPPFPVIGDKGSDLRDVWKLEPRAYLSIATSDFPNFFFASGPNFALANGTLLPCIETNLAYAFTAVAKMQRQSIKSMAPKPEAIDDFQEHKDTYMQDMAWSSNCRSWYKNGHVDGKIWGPWPGSAVHFLEVMAEPRWEDWDIKYTTKNRFSYFGNGLTAREGAGQDLTWYMTQPGA